MCFGHVVTNYSIHLLVIKLGQSNVQNETSFIDIRRLAYFDIKRADSDLDFRQFTRQFI